MPTNYTTFAFCNPITCDLNLFCFVSIYLLSKKKLLKIPVIAYLALKIVVQTAFFLNIDAFMLLRLEQKLPNSKLLHAAVIFSYISLVLNALFFFYLFKHLKSEITILREKKKQQVIQAKLKAQLEKLKEKDRVSGGLKNLKKVRFNF